MLRVQLQIKRYDLNKRAHAAIMRHIHQDVMKRHQYDRLPKHFEYGAYSEYGYQPRRSLVYQERKLRKFGHQLPNVYTGIMRRAVLNRCKITATQYKGRLETRGTSRHRLTNWQRDEIERVSPREKELEDKRMAREYKRLATSEKYARKRRRRMK